MNVLPAIDLREGACVQLRGGEYDDERVRLPDPLAVAERFTREGHARLHVVDLDAATGRGNNRSVVEALAARYAIQVGGGVRDEAMIAALLGAGCFRVVVGTRAVEDRVWLGEMSARFADKLVLAADVRARQVVTRGWKNDTGVDVQTLLDDVAELPLAALLITAVHVEGSLQGPDVALYQSLRARQPLIASGGIRGKEDLQALEGAGIHEAVVGMAMYV